MHIQSEKLHMLFAHGKCLRFAAKGIKIGTLSAEFYPSLWTNLWSV